MGESEEGSMRLLRRLVQVAQSALEADSVSATVAVGEQTIRAVETRSGCAGPLLHRTDAASMSFPVNCGESENGSLEVVVPGAGLDRALRLGPVFARHVGGVVGQLLSAAEVPLLDPEFASSIDRLMLDSASPRSMMRLLAGAVARWIGAELVGVMLWDEQRQVLQMLPGSFAADAEMVASYQVRAGDYLSNAARVFMSGVPYLSNAAVGDPGILSDYVAAFGIQNTLSVPLCIRGKPYGVLHMANKAGGFGLQDLVQAEHALSRLSAAISAGLRILELTDDSLRSEFIARTAVGIASGRPSGVFEAIDLEEACRVVAADGIVLQTDDLVRQACSADLTQEVVSSVLADIANSGVARVVRQPKRPGDPGRSALQLPVMRGDRRFGHITAIRLQASPFTSQQTGMLGRLASLAALAYTAEAYEDQRIELLRVAERARFADDLHDDVAQILFGAQMALDSVLEDERGAQRGHERILRARTLLIRGDAALRAVIENLNVADVPASGAETRLLRVLHEAQEMYDVAVELSVGRGVWPQVDSLDSETLSTLVRTAREAVVNSAKHSGARRIDVELAVVDDVVRLTVSDEGCGITSLSSGYHHGLSSTQRSVRRVGGSLGVQEQHGGGTRVVADFPQSRSVQGGFSDAVVCHE